MQTRILTIVYKSDITDEQWSAMKDEIIEDVLQQACDYAAAATDDEYEVDFYDGKMASGYV